MSWFRRSPTAEKKEADAVAAELDKARKKRRMALSELMEALASVPIEDGVRQVGEAIAKKEPAPQ